MERHPAAPPGDDEAQERDTGPLTRIGLGFVLLCLMGTLLVGLVAKQPCADGRWSDGRQYRQLCYTDIVPLLVTEQFDTGSRLPFLQPCDPETTGNCDEYPVLTMYAMRAAAWIVPPSGEPPSRSFSGFFYANAFLIAIAAAVTTVALYRMVGARALYFALAPTLLIYAFVNWDLLAVAFATLATLAYLRRRDVAAGVLLALGAAAKLFPALVAATFVVGRVHERRRVGAIRLAWAAALVWIGMNLPFAIAARDGWWEFFRFNGARPPDWDSLWFVACERIPGAGGVCQRITLVNVLSFVLFVGCAVLVWRRKAIREPDFPRWTFAFPLLVLFLLTNKVYSPQYGLWLLPWFALVQPDLRRFAAFEATDAAVFLTRFAFFGQMDPQIGGWVDAFTSGWLQIALLARAVVLVSCIVGWVRDDIASVAPTIMDEDPAHARTGGRARAPA